VSLQDIQTFNEWSLQLGREYFSPAEKNFRLNVFVVNLDRIQRHNRDKTKAYSMAVNHLADLTDEEFSKQYLSRVPASVTSGQSEAETAVDPSQPQKQADASQLRSPAASAAGLSQTENFDLLNVLQQSTISESTECSDGYAWISAVAMNANYYLKKERPIAFQFSPQTYIDCSANFGNQGCGGGTHENSYKYSAQYGIDTLVNYPYFGRQRPCRATTGFFRNAGVRTIEKFSNTELYGALSSKQLVISSYLDLSKARFYSGGIYNENCSAQATQGVLLVGAGTDPLKNLPYWLVVNTWGPMWGENGKMRILRYAEDGQEKTSSCGLNAFATFPWFN